MRFSLPFAASLAVSAVQASPVVKRHVVNTPTVNDGIILNYALTLEYLERKFYQEALANNTQAQFVAAGFKDPFYTNLKEIYVDEQTHVKFLSDALTAAKITPTVELQYTFPVQKGDVMGFATLASVLEGVGVSAYLGAAASIMNKDYLTAAGSILTVEARHTSYIRASLGESPFPAPFDTPLDFLPVQVRITAGNSDYKIDRLPAGIAGQVYVVLSQSNTKFNDENIIAGPAILEVYPK
ncbi:MAG: hypothetical protein Q9212_006174, partial [Teloschistes hypoglaucus]